MSAERLDVRLRRRGEELSAAVPTSEWVPDEYGGFARRGERSRLALQRRGSQFVLLRVDDGREEWRVTFGDHVPVPVIAAAMDAAARSPL